MSAPDDIVTRLRVKDGVYTEFWQQKLMDEAADEIERLRAEVDAIDALHQPNWHDNSNRQPMWCETCGLDWPCQTARLLHPMTLDEAIDTLGTVHK
jgi:hypothetical protein